MDFFVSCNQIQKIDPCLIDFFKNIFWYIIVGACVMANILKYVPRIQGVDERVRIRSRHLTVALDQSVCRRSWGLKHFSDDLKDQGICECFVHKNPCWNMFLINSKPETCAMIWWWMRHVPDWFVTQQLLRQWDDYYDDNGYIKWYDGYQKRKAQKAKIKEELMPIAWHPSRWWDWCPGRREKRDWKIVV